VCSSEKGQGVSSYRVFKDVGGRLFCLVAAYDGGDEGGSNLIQFLALDSDSIRGRRDCSSGGCTGGGNGSSRTRRGRRVVCARTIPNTTTGARICRHLGGECSTLRAQTHVGQTEPETDSQDGPNSWGLSQSVPVERNGERGRTDRLPAIPGSSSGNQSFLLRS